MVGCVQYGMGFDAKEVFVVSLADWTNLPSSPVTGVGRPQPLRPRHVGVVPVGMGQFGRMEGFSLLDLLVVVCILALFASVAVPAFRRYSRRVRAQVVLSRLQRLCDGAAAYYEESGRLARSLTGQDGAKRFPGSTAVTPTRRCCEQGAKGRCLGTDWDQPTWRALGFDLKAHRYRFQFVSSGLGPKASFTARALGDLDCDGLQSTYERVGWVDDSGKPKVSALVRAFAPGE